jgi:hypothetical protein
MGGISSCEHAPRQGAGLHPTDVEVGSSCQWSTDDSSTPLRVADGKQDVHQPQTAQLQHSPDVGLKLACLDASALWQSLQ